jgi:hypothetical protein
LGVDAVTQPDGNSGGAGGGARTFTQAELDHQISERLRREREKYADYPELRKRAEAADAQKSDIDKLTATVQALADRAEKAELENMRREVADGAKLPAFLRSSLTAKTKEDLERQAREMVEGLKSMGVDVAGGQNGGAANGGQGDTGGSGGEGDGKGGAAGDNGTGNGQGNAGTGNGQAGTAGNAGQGNAGGEGAGGGGGAGGRGRPREDLRSGANPGGGGDTFDASKVASEVLANRMF